MHLRSTPRFANLATYSLLASLTLCFSAGAWAAATKKKSKTSAQTEATSQKVTVEAIKTDKPVQIEIPERLRTSGAKLRIKNLTTGREVVLDISDEEFISSDIVKSLTDGTSKLLVPEFSILESTRRVQTQAGAPSDPGIGGYRNSKSIVYDQPIWRSIGFTTRKVKAGRTQILIDTKVQNTVLTPEQAERRRSLQESIGLKKLFDIGFRALAAKRFNIALEAFSRILKKQELLNAQQLSQASLGRGISKFHQEGCKNIEDDFRRADEDSKNFDDVSYYRALCFVEAKRFDDAAGLFKELARRQSPAYAEHARFYLGVVAENQERYDEAESAYLDTIDFAADKRVVELAKEHVAIVHKLKAEQNYENKWVTFMATLASGYDSNVVGLPQGLSPADYSLTQASSVSFMGLGSVELKPPFGKSVDNRLHYSFLALHYAAGAIANSYDVQSHDAGTSLDVRLGAQNIAGLGVGCNSVFLKPISVSTEYLATTSFSGKWAHVIGDPAVSTSDMEIDFKASLVRPRQAAIVPSYDSTANSYLVSSRYTVHRKSGSNLGDGLDIEYRPSTGSQNSYYSSTLYGRWDLPLGPEKWGISANQEAALQYTSYWQSVEKRKDYIARYTGSVARSWGEAVETRLQFVGTMSFSSQSAKYRYNKAQLNLLVTAFF